MAFIARQRAIGSGVIVDPDGYIMTNAHVVEGAQRIRVVMPLPQSDSPLDIPPIGQMQVLEAKLVGLHKDTDLALLKVDGHNLPSLPLGTRRPVHNGEMVLAIGVPKACRVQSPWESSAPLGGSRSPTSPWFTSRPRPPSIRVTAAARWSISMVKSSD